jgi:4'-phosphopantetheinyl transferase
LKKGSNYGGKKLGLFNQLSNTHWENILSVTDVFPSKSFYGGKEVHIWIASLKYQSYFYNQLSFEEQCKANSFRNLNDQHRYITSHYLLRRILAAYLGCHTQDIKFRKNKYGKLYLLDKDNIYFNMSHTQDVVSFILSSKNEVGIDLEYIDSYFEWESIARNYLTPEELIYLESIPKVEKIKGFYHLWTRKEALLKAIGTGLSGLDELNSNGLSGYYGYYSLGNLNINDKYQGSLAVKSNRFHLRFFKLLNI